MLGQQETKLITSWRRAQTEPTHLVYTWYNSRDKSVGLSGEFHYYVKILLISKEFLVST